MSEDTSARITVKRTIIDALNAALPEVDVVAGWPGDQVQPETMWPTDIDGNLDLPLMMADRHYRDDEFTITWAFRAGLPGQDFDEAEDRIAAMAAALDDALADDTTLGDDITVVESSLTNWKHICATDAEGVKAYGEAVTTHHCRYH